MAPGPAEREGCVGTRERAAARTHMEEWLLGRDHIGSRGGSMELRDGQAEEVKPERVASLFDVRGRQ
jgi:hypothetical protein